MYTRGYYRIRRFVAENPIYQNRGEAGFGKSIEIICLNRHNRSRTPTTDLKIKTGSSICYSEMKSMAAILAGLIQYMEIPLGAAFFYDDYWNVMNTQHEIE